MTDVAESAAALRGHERLPSTVARLAGPVLIERISISVLSAVDALLVGRYVGGDGVAAIGLCALLFWLALAGAFGLDLATTAVVARDYGSGDVERLRRTMRASLLIAFGWGILAAAVLAALGGPLLTLMAAEDDVRSFGVDYLLTAVVGLPLMMVLYAASGALRGVGNTVLPMLMVIVLNVVNAAVAFLLISGVIGIELEVMASGIGTAAGGAAGGLLAVVALGYGVGPARLRLDQALVTGRAELRRLANVGVPATLEEFQFMVAFLVYTRIVSGISTAAIAAHTVALRVVELAIVPGFAFGAAATTLVSRYLGAERPDLAERAARLSVYWTLAMMLTMAALLAAFAPQFVALFVDDEEVVDIGTDLLRVFAIALPFLGIYGSLGGALRGAGDVRYVLVLLTATAWFVRIPVAVFMTSVVGLGATGAWIGATTENVVRGGLIWRRFEQGSWKEREV